MIKIGVIGAGHLGKIHIRLLKELKEFEVVGFFEPNMENALKVEKELGVKWFSNYDHLLDEIDAADITAPTMFHFECAEKALKRSKHVFVEKPLVPKLPEAKALIKLAREANVKNQVGHVERFNPAFLAAKEHIHVPKFIETHRLAQYNPRGTDVSAILDLMIHDIDILLGIVRSNIKSIHASGSAIVSKDIDIATVRIEFEDGCVANLTCNRISLVNLRKTRIFQSDSYISIDFLHKKAEKVTLEDYTSFDPIAPLIELGEKGQKILKIEEIKVEFSNAIESELRMFARSITHNETTLVTFEEGLASLDLAMRIEEKIRKSVAFF